MSALFGVLVLIALACPSPEVVLSFGDTELNPLDRTILTQAVEQCPVRYPNSPCVKRFERQGLNDYLITCGPQETTCDPDCR